MREEAVLSTRHLAACRWASPYLSPHCVLLMTCSVVLYWSHQPRLCGCITSLTFIWSSCLTACLDWVCVLYSHVHMWVCECIIWHWPAKCVSVKYHQWRIWYPASQQGLRGRCCSAPGALGGLRVLMSLNFQSSAYLLCFFFCFSYNSNCL